jgi:hypothetical protein
MFVHLHTGQTCKEFDSSTVNPETCYNALRQMRLRFAAGVQVCRPEGLERRAQPERGRGEYQKGNYFASVA